MKLVHIKSVNDLCDEEITREEFHAEMDLNPELRDKIVIIHKIIKKHSQSIINNSEMITVDKILALTKDNPEFSWLPEDRNKKWVIRYTLRNLFPSSFVKPVPKNHNPDIPFSYEPKPIVRIQPKDLND